MDTPIIRPAPEADLAAIAAINAAVFLGDRDRPASALEWVSCWFQSHPMYQYFVIEVEGKIAGYAGWQAHGGFSRAEPVIELDQIGIDRAYQGQGLGPLFMEECMNRLLEWMQSKNTRIESHVSFVVWGYVLNNNAIKAYSRLFSDGICGMRTQFGNRAEIMFRKRIPIVMPVRDA